jgi:PTH1 family peptidyl-tRNA hydrolase
MFAIVGLGNPGTRYERTRHNAGFWAVDALAAELKLSSWKEKSSCLYLKADNFSQPCILAKPQKFMNLSGEAAVPLIRFFKIPVAQVIVVYDDLDLAPGVLRIRQGGGSGGHNGVEDMIRHLGDANFIRLRLGIGRPGWRDASTAAGNEEASANANRSISDWVLSNPDSGENELIQQSVQKALQAIKIVVNDGVLQAQNQFQSRVGG